MPTLLVVKPRVFAAAICSGGTTRGITDPRVDPTTANAADCTATSESMIATESIPASEWASSPSVDAHSPIDPTRSTRRRSSASATAPPQSPKTIRGTSPTAPIMPTQNDDPVMS
jgi:hypothetical protein